MRTNNQSCPICGSTKSQHSFTKQSRGIALNYRKCDECSVLFRGAFDEQEQDQLYDYQASWENLSREEAYGELNATRYRDLLKRFSRLAPGKRLLDVGCGKGHFVYRAQDEGWDALGLEIYQAAVDAAHRFESPVQQKDFLSLSDQRFDVITMFELVEHLEDPRAFIQKASELLVNGGLLFITTPNAVCLDARLAGPEWRAYDPEHLVLFSQDQLVNLVREQEFRIIKVASRNLSPTIVKRSVRRLLSPAIAKGTESLQSQPTRSRDQEARQHLRGNALTASLIEIANLGQGVTKLGSTIRILARKE